MFQLLDPVPVQLLLQDIFVSIALKYYLIYLLHIHASNLIRGQNDLYFFISFLSYTYYIFYFKLSKFFCYFILLLYPLFVHLPEPFCLSDLFPAYHLVTRMRKIYSLSFLYIILCIWITKISHVLVSRPCSCVVTTSGYLYIDCFEVLFSIFIAYSCQ